MDFLVWSCPSFETRLFPCLVRRLKNRPSDPAKQNHELVAGVQELQNGAGLRGILLMISLGAREKMDRRGESLVYEAPGHPAAGITNLCPILQLLNSCNSCNSIFPLHSRAKRNRPSLLKVACVAAPSRFDRREAADAIRDRDRAAVASNIVAKHDSVQLGLRVIFPRKSGGLGRGRSVDLDVGWVQRIQKPLLRPAR
jgi:hypothetical protein